MFKVMQLNADDMKMMGTKVDTLFRKNERALFASEGASGGSKWPALSPGYAAWKKGQKLRKSGAKMIGSNKIMVLTGRLKSSLTSKNGDHFYLSSLLGENRGQITVGTKVDTAAKNIKGNPLSDAHVPERDTLQYTPAQGNAYQQIVKDRYIQVKLPRLLRALRAWRQRKPKRTS